MMELDGDGMNKSKNIGSSSSNSNRSNHYLEQFLLLAKGTEGKATGAIITKILNHKQIFHVGQVLDLPNVQALKNTENGYLYRLLEIFAFGVYDDYVQEKAELGQLNQEQLRKLRLLTLVSLANKSDQISYEHMKKSLGLNTNREIEDLVIDANYSKLVNGKLDFLEKIVYIRSATGRDVQTVPGPDGMSDIDRMMSCLSDWLENSKLLMETLESIKTDAAGRQTQDAERQEKLEAKVVELHQKHANPKRPVGPVSASDKMKMSSSSRRGRKNPEATS